MRSLAYVEIIKALRPIEGADKIECAEVLGWECVVKKGDFKVNDLSIYIEIDSILPDLPVFEFMRQKKFRVRTIKLRGQVSQGLVLPLSILSEVDPSIKINKLKVGDDLTEALRIVKYDPEVLDEPTQVKKSWIANKWSYLKWRLFGIKPVKKGSFPSDVPKTNEERVQKMGSELTKREGELVYISEKMEGASCTFIYRKGGNWLAKLLGRDYIFQICSRNRIVYNSRSGGETNHYLVQLAEKYNMLEVLKKLNRNIAVQGESIGPKLQGNIYKLPEVELKVFLIYNLDAQKYLSFVDTQTCVSELGLPFVPLVGCSSPLVNGVKYYVELSKGKSQLSNVDREGIVIRSMDGSFSFKSINPEYLLKQE